MSYDDELKQAADVLRSGNASALKAGQFIDKWMEEGRDFKAIQSSLRTLGVHLPGQAVRSRWRGAWKGWCKDAGAAMDVPYGKSQMRLDGLPIDKLYYLRRAVTQIGVNKAVDYAATHPEADCRVFGRTGAPPTTPAPDRPTDIVTWKTLRSVKDAAEHLAFKLGDLEGYEVSTTAALEWAIGELDSLSDDSMDFLWRQAHGEVTEDEARAATTPVFDVVSDSENEGD